MWFTAYGTGNTLVKGCRGWNWQTEVRWCESESGGYRGQCETEPDDWLRATPEGQGPKGGEED